MHWRDLYVGVVNLTSRPDRLVHATKEVNKLGIPWTRHRGMLPSEFEGQKYEMMRRRTPGAIGCWMTQREVLLKAAELKRSALVLEDDILFSNDIQGRLDYIEQFADRNEFDIFYLGATFHREPQWHASGHPGEHSWCRCNLNRDWEATDDPRILRVFGEWGTYAWIARQESIPKIVEMLDENIHRSIGIDHALIQLGPELKCYCMIPGSAFQVDGESNIGAGRTLFSHFSKMGEYVWQPKSMFDYEPEGDFACQAA